jgi:hypothetical protein
MNVCVPELHFSDYRVNQELTSMSILADTGLQSSLMSLGENPVTIEELEGALPNGFHDAKIFSFEVDYVAGIAKFRMNLLVGWPDDPEPERQTYQEAVLVVSDLCLLSVDPPSSKYPFLPDGKPICVSGDAAKSDHLPSLQDLVARFPDGTWCYRFFVDDWNAFIHIAGRNGEVTWVGEKPKHAA